jgi:hypothetical protein
MGKPLWLQGLGAISKGGKSINTRKRKTWEMQEEEL